MPVAIVHPTLGIYIGGFLGLAFWSKCDPAGQSSVVTFLTVEIAKKHVSKMKPVEFHDKVDFVEVVPDRGYYASIDACVKAGLDGWEL